MGVRQDGFPAVLAVVAGMAVWGVAALLTGKRDLLDAPVYWTLAYPLAIAVSAGLAFRFPQRPVLVVLLVFESQFPVMAIRNGEPGNLWPLALVMFAIISLPAVLLAKIVANRSPWRPQGE